MHDAVPSKRCGRSNLLLPLHQPIEVVDIVGRKSRHRSTVERDQAIRPQESPTRAEFGVIEEEEKEVMFPCTRREREELRGNRHRRLEVTPRLQETSRKHCGRVPVPVTTERSVSEESHESCGTIRCTRETISAIEIFERLSTPRKRTPRKSKQRCAFGRCE